MNKNILHLERLKCYRSFHAELLRGDNVPAGMRVECGWTPARHMATWMAREWAIEQYAQSIEERCGSRKYMEEYSFKYVG